MAEGLRPLGLVIRRIGQLVACAYKLKFIMTDRRGYEAGFSDATI
jgi:hypothetical protein